MNQPKILELRVKKHVFNYLAQHYPQPYQLKQTDMIGCTLYQLLRKGPVDKRKEEQVAKYECVFKVSVGEDQAFTRGARRINARIEQQFNNFIKGLIEQALHDFIAMCKKKGITREAAVADFMLMHDISEDEITADALIKSNQRHIERLRNIKKESSPFKIAA